MNSTAHFAEADRLLAKAASMDATLAISRALVAQAQVHALLALCPTQTVQAAQTLENIRNQVPATTTGIQL